MNASLAPKKLVLAVLLVVALAVGLIGVLAAQQPTRQPFQLSEKAQALINAKPLEPEAGDDDLRKLLKARYNAALSEVRNRYDALAKGRGTLDPLFDAGRRLFEAELDLYAKPAERITALEKLLEFVKEFEVILERNLKAEIGTPADLDRLRFGRLTIEVALVKAKREAGMMP
jgi:hypothetical protein